MPTEFRATDPRRSFPATVRLPPYRSVLRLGADGRLLGLDPDTALAVDRLPGELATMLDELTEPTDSAGLVARATERGACTEVAVHLLDELLRVGAIIDAELVERSARQRAQSIVVVSGDGPLTVGVVLGLVQAGVGRVCVDTAGVVLACDLGTGYLDTDRGQDRLTATRDAAHRIRPDAAAVVAAATGRQVPDLEVLADALGPEPERVTRLHAAGTAHMPVRLRDGIGVVGPLVLPGRSACLGCLELSRRARAPCWPTVAAQLTGRRGRADPASTAATAALATAQAVAALDAIVGGGAPPPTLETSIELDARGGTVVRRRWHPMPGCGCGASARREPGVVHHDTATSAEPTGGETIMV